MIFDALARPRPQAGKPAPWDDYWYMPLAPESKAGVQVTADASMRVSAVYACVRVLAETLASLPLFVYRRLPNGGKQKAVDHPLYHILHDAPNQWQTAFQFFEMMQGHVTLRGNAYAQRVPGRRGATEALIPLHPDRVDVERLDTGRLRYTVYNPQTSQRRTLTQDQMLHIPGLSFDGVTGLSPIEYARDIIGLSIAAESHGSYVFANKAVPGAVMTTPNRLSDEARKNVRQVIHDSHARENVHRTMVLEEGLTWQQMGMSNEDAQFLETRKYQIAEIARIFRVQLHIIQEMEHATYTNIEHQGIEFVVHTMRPWLVRWEQAINRALIGEPDTYFVEFLVDGLLRGDQKSRYEAYERGLNSAFLAVNEVRAWENLNPWEGYDEPVGEPAAEPGDNGAAETPTPPAKGGRESAGELGSPVNREALAILVSDVAERLASNELRELEKCVARAAEDRDKFNERIERFYVRHKEYACRALAPLLRAWAAADGPRPDEVALIASVADEPCKLLCQVESPGDILTAWQSARADELKNTILKGFGDERKAAA